MDALHLKILGYGKSGRSFKLRNQKLIQVERREKRVVAFITVRPALKRKSVSGKIFKIYLLLTNLIPYYQV